MTVAFAMIGCPTDGGGDDKKPDRTITFELGDTAGYDADTAVVPDPVTVKDSTVLTLDYLKTVADVAEYAKDNYVFTRWQVKGKTDVISGSQTYKITSNITLVAIWEPPVKVTFIPWAGWDADTDDNEGDDDDYWPQEFIFANDTGFVDYEDYDFPNNPGIVRTDLVFGKWVDSYNNTVDADNTKFTADTLVTGVWYSTELEIDTEDADNESVEKLYLENGSYAIYEFELPSGKTIADVKEVLVDYKLSEAGMNRQVRQLRLMGPYIYNDFVSHVATDAGAKVPYFGDFVMDKNGAFAAKYNATDNASTYADNKNAPYINYNINGADWAGSAQAAFGDTYEIEANEWFTATYTFSLPTFNSTTVARVKGTANAPVATNASKIYFGIGIPSGGGDKPKEGIPGRNGNIQLVKDITLTFTSGDDTVEGKVPSFGDQVFASYIDPVVFCWRGAADDDIVYPTDPASPVAGFPNISTVDLGDFDATTGEGYFYVNLSNNATVGASSIGPTATATFAGTGDVFNQGTLTVSFTGPQAQRINIGLLPDNISALQKATGTLKFTIASTSTTEATTFRYHLGDPFAGGSWNGTGGSNGGTALPFKDLVAGEHTVPNMIPNPDFDEEEEEDPDDNPKEIVDPDTPTLTVSNNTQPFSANKSGATLSYFILQTAPYAGDQGSRSIVISSIKVEYTQVPEVPATPATEDLVVYKSTAAGGTGTVVKMDIPAASLNDGWAPLTDFNTAVATITFPTGLTIRSYEKFDIKVKYYGAGDAELTPAAGNQWAQVSFNGSINHYGLGLTSTGSDVNDGTVGVATSLAKYDTIKDATSLTLNFQRRNTTPATVLAIELLEVVFYAPEE